MKRLKYLLYMLNHKLVTKMRAWLGIQNDRIADFSAQQAREDEMDKRDRSIENGFQASTLIIGELTKLLQREVAERKEFEREIRRKIRYYEETTGALRFAADKYKKMTEQEKERFYLLRS